MKNHSSQSGLTLPEVIIAIVLFAGAMITILGLQSSNLARANEDKNKIKAMLAAREILAAIEIQEDPIPLGTQEGTVEKVLSSLIDLPERPEDSIYGNLLVTMNISNVALPLLGEAAMQKVEIVVSWGDLPFESFRTSYFIPGELNLQPQGN